MSVETYNLATTSALPIVLVIPPSPPREGSPVSLNVPKSLQSETATVVYRIHYEIFLI